MSGDHNMYQKDKSYLDFECPRCGHCCQAAGEEHMTKLEAWKAWCESAGTPDLATEFTLEQSSHGKAFSFAWERGFVDGMQHQMKSSVEKALEPVAWADKVGAVIPHSHKLFQPDLLKDYTRPLYTAPKKTEQEQVECMCGICKLGKREWVGLTDDDIEKCTIAAERDYERYMHATRGQQLGQRDQLDWWIARAIEAKLKEKNT